MQERDRISGAGDVTSAVPLLTFTESLEATPAMAVFKSTPLPPRRMKPVLDACTQRSDGCWLFNGRAARYGVLAYKGRRYIAHRAAWQFANGCRIPKDRVIMHACDVKGCVRPDHLVLGTYRENTADMLSKRRHQHGEIHRHAKLTDALVAEALSRINAGESLSSVARAFGVSYPTIQQVVTGHSWKHVQRPEGWTR